jgi:integrase/recombinase XerD
LFLYNKSKTNVTPRYLNHIRSILFSFFDWCQNEGYISRNPVKNINRIKYIPKEIEPLSEKDLEICRLAYLELPYRDQVMFEFFYSTGCRCQEVCELKIKDVNFDTKTVRVIGKGNKPRTVFLNEKATLMLQHYLSTRAINSEYLFVTRRKPYTKLSVDAVENVFRALGRKVGFHIHPHMMRHTMATIALSRGMPLEEVQTILGHSSPETTMIYTKVNNSNIQYHHSKFVS